MTELISAFGLTAVLFGILFIAALAVLWAILPFAVFGIKRRLDMMVHHQEQANRWLKYLSEMEDAKRRDRETIQ